MVLYGLNELCNATGFISASNDSIIIDNINSRIYILAIVYINRANELISKHYSSNPFCSYVYTCIHVYILCNHCNLYDIPMVLLDPNILLWHHLPIVTQVVVLVQVTRVPVVWVAEVVMAPYGHTKILIVDNLCWCFLDYFLI